MTRDDIIRMAREAGSIDSEDVIETVYAAFAAAEREKVAAWMINRSYATGHGDTVEDLLKELEWQIREAEREACIRDCNGIDLVGADECIAAIRTRGETK